MGSAADAAGQQQNRNTSAQNAQAQQRVAARPATTRPATTRQATTRQAATRHVVQGGTRATAPAGRTGEPALTPVSFRGAALGGTPILHVAQSAGLSCVPFARMATGMQISGDARLWWYNAAGSYARGNAPERGSVLAFKSSGGMRRGHVAVVSRVVNDRTILIDHSNWAGPGIRRGTVMRGVTVIDVSDRNDWTAVRVQVGWDNDSFGRVYPAYGFIYNRPHGARILTAQAEPMQEVAEAPSPHVLQHERLAQTLGR
ncbi:CHAP domain-containing protein [Falsiroseomonas bella]|uniref:CHAP domain-containing protein n=1 Tax=Falsiroseomonas bella TaxID=2184016 RepID=UPI001E3D009E|nr:CHAP domain-containing protein [Falsiroseomonas bella]